MPKNLSYPLNVEGDDQQGHYIMFMINESTSAAIAKADAADMAKTFAGMGYEKRGDVDNYLNKGVSVINVEEYRSKGATGVKSGLYVKRPPTTRLAEAITLYMPPSVKVSYKSNYKDDEISARASLGASVAGGIIDVFSGQNGGGDKGGITEGVGQIAVSFAAAAADTFGPGAVTLAQLSFGSILGSKMEVMFTDVGRRNFSFQFNFIPKSEQEARMVYDIVQTFKHHMLPEYKTGLNLSFLGKYKLGQGRILNIPNTFDISYFYHDNENPFLNRISTCYLTSMDVDYGGEKYVTYEPIELEGQVGPPPQRTNITLAFTEIETITRERAAQGF